ncbi:glycosyltransferase family 2 protein [Alteraurantiacibacter buctensis]|uniref:Glycosyltransferase n=1 Tax=Alteraurantiacibacter buctensis TaxID=1503981 RepID=A0A844Z4B2_9SPHN|nr:glycosyltransferase [Alteraurantiacibacter buctensis]MXO73457.1 glycosyltransferase [Alteraurantiacibacter buctensis]
MTSASAIHEGSTGATPPLSVAMSVYNGARFLESAIDSVLAQDFADFEFLIVDDGSSDGTPDILRAYAARDPRVIPIVRENRGLVASLNQLLGLARAPLVARMDADDLAAPDRFSAQLAFLAEHPEVGVLGSWTTDIDEYGEPCTAGPEDHPVTHEEFLANVVRGGPLLAHPTVIYRRDVVLSVGGYHKAFRHCEDFDLWLRLADRTRIANLPRRLLRYRHYAGQVSQRHAVEQQIGVAVARLAQAERAAGRPDPTETLDALPPLAELDALFGRPDVAQEVRGRAARSLVYSREAMTGAGYDLLLQHVEEGGTGRDLWRTAARLLRFGEPARALRLAAALASR